jgi:hypothetical protein
MRVSIEGNVHRSIEYEVRDKWFYDNLRVRFPQVMLHMQD